MASDAMRDAREPEAFVLAVRFCYPICYPKSTQLLKTRRYEPGWRARPDGGFARFYWAK
jgi:hypothetical protein